VEFDGTRAADIRQEINCSRPGKKKFLRIVTNNRARSVDSTHLTSAASYGSPCSVKPCDASRRLNAGARQAWSQCAASWRVSHHPSLLSLIS